MPGREHVGWRDDRPCPEWCAIAEQHIGRVRPGNDFWHESAPVDLATADTDRNWHPVPLKLHLLQREQVDERGHIRHPAVVGVGGSTLTTAQARALAEALLLLITQADDEPHDVPRRR